MDTDREQSESSVTVKTSQEQRESHEALTSNMGEGFYTVNDQGLATGMNPTAEKLFGRTFDELRGKKMHHLTRYKHRDATPYPAKDCSGLKVLREGIHLINHEDVFMRKDGTSSSLSCSLNTSRHQLSPIFVLSAKAAEETQPC